jgi:hypothetical protein
MPHRTNHFPKNPPSSTAVSRFKVVGPAAVAVLPQLKALSDQIPGTWADRAVIQVSPQPSEKAIRRLGEHAELGPTDLAVLGSLGPAATPVVPKLQQIAEHSPFTTLRTAARRALEQIQAKSKPE